MKEKTVMMTMVVMNGFTERQKNETKKLTHELKVKCNVKYSSSDMM